MAKANKKAMGRRNFEILTTGEVNFGPNHRAVKLKELAKRERRRNEHRMLNLSKFKREDDRDTTPIEKE
ncbi:MAG: hypothetical protein EHM34_00220 [Nitrosopumilales archaeon]|nr:MAG: hypothetical protein EHM34_00220 [Nitrosopumilales archaeon]